MPLLKFEVQADYEKVIRLRNEIDLLNEKMSKIDSNTPRSAVRRMEVQLQSAQQEFSRLTNAALIAGREMEDGFKKRIYDASVVVNDLSERIIVQRGALRTATVEAKRYADQYREAVKNGTDTAEMKRQYMDARQELEKQKDAMFSLTQEQSSARLAVRRLSDEYKMLKADVGESTIEIDRMLDGLMGSFESKLKNGLGKGLGMIGIGTGIGSFFSQMIGTRGEFQDIETSLEVLLGNEERAAELMGKVKEFAKVSPLDLKSTAAATQMMLGFNIEAEKVPRFLSAIGDISMGDAGKFNSLTLAFSQMSATGKLMGQDLNQMINAGFNPLQIMAEKSGKSISTLKDEMSKGAISAEMVQQAFIDATDAGGKFYQMSEKSSQKINGQLSMLQDAVDAMFNDMGQASEGFVIDAISGATSLVENYEKVMSIMAGLIATYGTYKAVVMTQDIWSNAITNFGYDSEIENLEALLHARKESAKSDLEQAVADGAVTEAKAEKIKALREEARAQLELLATKEATLRAEISEGTREQMSAMEREQEIQGEIEALQEKAEVLFDLGDSVEFEAVQEEIATLQTDLHTASQERETAVSRVQTAQTQLNAVATEREALANAGATASTNILAAAKTKLIKVIESLYARVAANPWGFALAAVTALSYGIYKLITYESEYDKIIEDRNTSINRMTEAFAKEKIELDEINERLGKAKKGSDEWTAAKDEAVSKYGQYFNKLDAEIEKVGDLSSAYTTLTKNIQKSLAAKEIEKFESSHEIDLSKLQTRLREKAEKSGLSKEQVQEYMLAYNTALLEGDTSKLTKAQAKLISSGEGTFGLGRAFNGKILDRRNLNRQKEAIAANWGMKLEDLTNPQKTDSTPAKSYAEARKEAEKAYKDAKKHVEDLKAGLIKDATDKDYEAAAAALKSAKEQAEKLGIDTTGKSSKAAEKTVNNQEKLNRETEALERKNQSAITALMAEGKEKRLKTIQQEYDDRMAEIKRQREDWVKENKESSVKGLDASGLTEKQYNALALAEVIANDQREKSTKELYDAEVESMRDFLSEYGTFQQQKLAITESYAKKIRDAQTEGEKLTLGKQRDAALQQVEISALEQRINWGSVLGNFGTILKDQLQPTIDALKEITQTDEFKASSIEDQQKIWEMLAKLTSENSVWNPDMLTDFTKAVDEYQHSMYNLIKAQEAEASLARERTNIEAKLAAATDPKERERLNAILADLSKSATDAAIKTHEFEGQVQRTTFTLNTAATKMRTKLENFVSGIQSLTSNSLSGIWSGVESLEKAFDSKEITNVLSGQLSKLLTKMFGKDSTAAKKLTESLGQTGMAGAIISAAFEILDILKGGIGNFIGSIIDTVLGAINGILRDILKGQFAVDIFNSLKDGIGGILNTITFGGLKSWLNTSNAKEVAETTERLTNSNERLSHAIDNLKNEISKSGGAKAINAANEAKADQEKIIEQTAQILMAQMGYHGAHHSNAAKWNLSANDYASLNMSLADFRAKNPMANVTQGSVGSLEDIYKLTPEQMDYIRSFNIDMWEKMISQGKYDKSEYWEKYADLAGSLEELNESLKESLTQTSFDGMRSSFASSLMDMKKDAQSWSDDFSEMLMASVLNARISDEMDNEIKEFYEKWAGYAESDKKTESWEIEDLKKDWDALTKQGLAIRDQVAAITGYNSSSSYSQSASTGYSTTISEDTGTEISGRMTAIQESQYREESILGMSLESLQAIEKQLVERYAIADDVRHILADCYLELVAIGKNTKAIIEPIRQMAESIDRIKQQTENL